MRRLSIMVLALAFVCSLTACSSIDWVDFVKWDNIIYVRDTTTDSIPKEYIGDLIGSVKKVAPSIVRIPNYKPKNGMAAFLELDTEFYEIIGYEGVLNQQIWVKYDEALCVEDTVEIVIQINGKVKDKILIDVNSNQEEVLAIAIKSTKISEALEGKSIIKQIYVPNKLVNFVAR